MKILFVCYTYFQLITACQIRTNLFEGEDADLILSDNSVNADTVCEKLKDTQMFDHVGYAKISHLFEPQSIYDKIKDTFIRLIGKSHEIDSMNLYYGPYDFIFYFNQNNILTQYFYDKSVFQGITPMLFRMEENILSYHTLVDKSIGDTRWRLIMKLRKKIWKDNTCMNPKGYYCFYPELISEENVDCVRIPYLSREDTELISNLNYTFGYNPEQDNYFQKYIFFSSSLDVDERSVGETELVKQIAEIVGKENLLVKMHPRDGRNVYEKIGLNVYRNSFIPWELSQLTHDYSDHVFITVSSGSVMTASAMLGDDLPIFYLYPLIAGKNVMVDDYCQNNIKTTIEKMQRIGFLKNVHVANSLDEIIV